MQVGLFFGSFNPVHVGHMIIANHLADEEALDQVWMVVTPQSPFKKKRNLANNHDRLHLVRLAIDDHPGIRASDIEFGLPIPSYTIDTLTYLKEKYPTYRFCLIMGSDNLKSLHKWKNADLILKNHEIYVYERPGYAPESLSDLPNVHLVQAPLLHVSSSYIRKRIREKKSIKYLVTERVFDYIQGSNMYREKEK